MRFATAAAVVCSIAACERADSLPVSTTSTVETPPVARVADAAPKPAASTRAQVLPEAVPPAPDPAPIEEPPPAPPPTPPRPRTVRPAIGPLPEPPSVVPSEYRVWLRKLPADQRAQVAQFCRKHRQDFQTTCGGIGPLHIPYPPFPRVRMKRAGDGTPDSLFASAEEWRASLSGAQLAYLDRECPGGEDQPSSDLCGDNTPLVIAFDAEPVTFAAGTRFAFEAGAPTATDWPTAATPWLAYDRDGDGAIDRGAELFGSATVLPDGRTAVNGFAALRALDENLDGVIDAADSAFGTLLLWGDADADGRGAGGELRPAAATLVSISLDNRVEARCDGRGNCEGERATVIWRDGRGVLRTGAVVDLYLPRR